MDWRELEQFYLGLVEDLRTQGITCAVTSGMACVALGVSQATKDCDILCPPMAAAPLLERLSTTRLNGSPCQYRGFISPPLDERWLNGGWTSHFFWKGQDEEAYLDIFGIAPRLEEPWQKEISGPYASAHVVAAMKRTSRARDWDAATALGVKLLREGDPRGWLHIFESRLLSNLMGQLPCPTEIIARRPILALAANRDARLDPALWAEQFFWQELDRLRLDVYEEALRPYLVCVRENGGKSGDLFQQHTVRMNCAERSLDPSPILRYGIQALVEKARDQVARVVLPELLQWLPDPTPGFAGIR